jgi:AAA15 family ATPase/GTPase
MLIEFRVGNFLSFRDIAALSMVASPDKEHIDTHTVKINDKLRLLRSVAVYGANASGKTNLFKAMDFMRDFILNSSKESLSDEKILVEKFRLSSVTETEPSTFELVFIIDGMRYRYGFQADHERVHNEWLFYVPTIREATLFVREKDVIKLGAGFKEGKGLEEKTRPNALFLSVVDQFNGETAKKILKWVRNLSVVSALDDSEHELLTISSLADKEFKEFALKLLKVSDIGIKDIRKKAIPLTEDDLPAELPARYRKKLHSKFVEAGVEAYEINLVHQKYDADKKPVSDEAFRLESQESAGTRALFAFSAPIYYTLKNNRILVIDELTSKLHPLLTRALVEIFHQYNSGKDKDSLSRAQLIFASHDTNMLSKRFFRRDQVWFTQKDECGASDLYSLEEFRIRKDASFNKDYIMGKYGAIPFIGDIDSLF